MAANTAKSGKRLIQDELAVMLRLTRDLATATAQGDLDRALEILEKRRRTLKGFSWPEKADPDFWEKVRALRDLEEEVLAFCSTWREVVEKRLRSLNTGHFLRMSYCPPAEEARFIDVNK
jgi:2,4-dienoyl-CoA reductase-like NADH-dependent reductase (Old Yellow Enzyme family)